MGRRSGFGSLITAVARDIARAQRASVAAQKRALREHERSQKAHARALRQQQRSHAALTREMEREAKRQHLEDQLEAASDRTSELAATIDELDQILLQTIAEDDTISFESLRVSEEYPAFQPPAHLSRTGIEPLPENYLIGIEPTGFLARLFPGAEERHRERLRAAQDRYAAAVADFRAHEEERIRALDLAKKQYDEKRFASVWEATQRNSEVAEFERKYLAGDTQSVIAYCAMVLARSEYSVDFPQNFRLAYQSASREVVVDYELPSVAIIPSAVEVRYIKSRDEFEEKARKPAEIRERYQKLVASISLRTIHELLEADQGHHIDVVTFSGFVQAVDPAIGRDIRPYLISVRTTRIEFEAIDLARVDPRVCVRNLGASVSARADELVPVKPIVEFDMVDPRFVEQIDVLGELDARPNIMDLTPFQFENLVGNVFAKMGLDTRQTRSSRDGGVDVVAYDSRPVLGGRVVIQAKRYRNTVGVSAVSDLFGTMMNEGANKGILVTTSGYGPDAFTFAKDKPIELIDGGQLLFLCDQVGVKARIVMPAE
jgi:restriction system protein